MQAIHSALVFGFPAATLARLPVFQHWEDDELGHPPLYELLQLEVAPGGVPTWCRSNREGTGLEGRFLDYHGARHPAGPHALVFDAKDRATLRAHGWQGTGGWFARWSADEPERVAEALAVLGRLSPRVLLPEDLGAGTPWPWAEFVSSVLLADVEGSEGHGEQRVLLTCLDGQRHRVRVPEGSSEEALWRWWTAHPPAMRPYAQWYRA